MTAPASVSPEGLAAIGGPAGLEAVLVLRRNGQALGGWTKRPAPSDVISVMTATLFGSAETLLETLGKASPPELVVASETTRVLLRKAASGNLVLVVGPASIPDAALRAAAAKVAALLPQPAAPSVRG